MAAAAWLTIPGEAEQQMGSVETISSLTREAFARSPVWALSDSEDEYISVPVTSQIPKDMGLLFIWARFTLRAGQVLDGYLCGVDHYFAFFVFVDDEKFRFNAGLPDLSALQVDALRLRLGMGDRDPGFPVSYQASLLNTEGAPIAGTLDWFGA